MLYGFSWVMGNSYALALILYALVFKLVFLPFAIKQQKNQVKMANLTPKIELIKAKYRGRTDRATMQKMQQEIMELQEKEGVSMFGGCLPLLIQFPIIIFLYNVIRNPLSYICGYTQANWDTLFQRFEAHYVPHYTDLYTKTPTEAMIAGTHTLEQAVADASSKAAAAIGQDQIQIISKIKEFGINYSDLGNGRPIPDMSLFGVDLGYTPNAVFENWALWALILIPVLAAAFQWLTMFLTKKWNGNANQVAGAAADAQTQASTKIMDIIFPLMTLWMAFSFSALMGLYWIFQSVLAIVQTFILAKAMPLPKFTEAQLKQMKREQKAVEKATQKVIKNQKYRSLHYIDEDDYDELPEVKSNTNEKDKNSGMLTGNDLPNIKD